MNKFIIMTAAACTAFAAPASAFVAKNSLEVEGDIAGTFMVPGVGANGAADYWCAAGEFVKAEAEGEILPSQLIYRVTPVPRDGDEGMEFSLIEPANPIGDAPSAGETGQMTVSLARSYCDA